jgi:pyridoxal phosphate enzyme (YggS family)
MISENIHTIQEKITKAADKADRSPEDIKLVAVSKRFPVTAIQEAYAGGQTLFGENYIQEVQQKRPELPEQVRFHFIGHLQTNKAKIAAESCAVIETVDRLKLAIALSKHLEKLQKDMDILVQVNIGEDPGKSGVSARDAENLLTELKSVPRIHICGLMTMPPLEPDPELSRPYFRRLRLLAEELSGKGLFVNNNRIELSMGMSSDYHIAIEEGATIVRVGTAIFGDRPARK